MLAIYLIIACSRYIYNGFMLHAHPARGESHNQRNAPGEVATPRCGDIGAEIEISAGARN